MEEEEAKEKRGNKRNKKRDEWFFHPPPSHPSNARSTRVSVASRLLPLPSPNLRPIQINKDQSYIVLRHLTVVGVTL